MCSRFPTLRHIAITQRYFHSGSVWDLQTAVGVMGSGRLGATPEADQEASIPAFPDSPTGEMPQIIHTTLPPSTPIPRVRARICG